jgi:hypothetical protein
MKLELSVGPISILPIVNVKKHRRRVVSTWDIKTYSPLKRTRHFGETFRFQLQGRWISQERNQHKAGRRKTLYNHRFENLKSCKQTRFSTSVQNIITLMYSLGRSQWPHGLRHKLSSLARSNAGIVGSNPTQGMDVCVCVYSVCVVLCVGSGLAMGWSVVQRVLLTV